MRRRFPAPEKPAADEPDGAMKFEQAQRDYEARREELKARKAELERELAEAETPAAPFEEDKAIREVFLRTVSRPPTGEEFAQGQERCRRARRRRWTACATCSGRC